MHERDLAAIVCLILFITLSRQPAVDGAVLSYSTFLGGSNAAVANAIAVDSKGCAYVTGYALSSDMRAKPLSTRAYGVSTGVVVFVCKFNPKGTGLDYVTYLGGDGYSEGIRIAIDARGNAYVVGATYCTNFPTRNAFQPTYGGGPMDCFAAKLLPDGSLEYSTYLGGSGQDDNMPAIAVDEAGSAYVVGSTFSTNFPTTPLAFRTNLVGEVNSFVTKLTPNGTGLVYSTYLGGNLDDYGYGIAVDSNGNAYVCGNTSSTNFPVVNAFQPSLRSTGIGNAFVAKLNSTGSALLFSTYFGGSGNDGASAISVDSFGNVYIAGTTDSPDFPLKNPLQPSLYGGSNSGFNDAFVAKLDPTGTNLLYSTYLGGSDDRAQDLAVDTNGNAYITGTTDSADFPITNAVQPVAGVDANSDVEDAFVVKINPSGTALVYSSYLGGTRDDEGNGIAVDSHGDAYVTGFSDSQDFPLVHPYQSVVGGSFVTKIHDTPAPPNHDFAIEAILAPKDATVSSNNPDGVTKRLVVCIQNRSDHSETIATFNNLTNLVALSTSGCDGDLPVLAQSIRNFPITMKPGATVSVLFDQLFESCEGDYTFSASLNGAALDGMPAANTNNDICPRPPTVAGGIVIDPGCGARNPDHTLGADVVTHVDVKN